MFLIILVSITLCLVLSWILVSRKSTWGFLLGQEAFILHADQENHNTIVGVFFLEKQWTLAQMKQFVAKTISLHPEFQQCYFKRYWRYSYFKHCPKLELESHLIATPSLSSTLELQKYVNQLQNTSFNLSQRPPWEIHLCQDYGGKEGTSIVIFKVHHCICDGASAIQLLLKNCSTNKNQMLNIDNKKEKNLCKNKKSSMSSNSNVSSFKNNLITSLRLLFAKEDRIGSIKLAQRVQDTRVSWTEPFSLEIIKTIANASGTTINDVLLAALSFAIREQVKINSIDESMLSHFHSIMWCGLKPFHLEENQRVMQLGNRIGTCSVRLPLEENVDSKRLEKIHLQTKELKCSFQPALSYYFMTALGYLPPFLCQWISEMFIHKMTTSISNVPGPQRPFYLDDIPVNHFFALTKAQGRIGLFCLLLSYNGKVSLALSTDSRIKVQHSLFLNNFSLELKALQKKFVS